MKSVTAFGLGIGTSTAHQVATVMTSAPIIQPALPANSASSFTTDASNFSGNHFWIPPNFTHSVFFAHIVDRPHFKSKAWILDTSATNHMVHLVSQLTTITSTVHSYVFLPNGDQALVTRIGIVQISPTLTLTNVLCVPTFSFNPISISKLTQQSSCCLIFLGHWCFI